MSRIRIFSLIAVVLIFTGCGKGGKAVDNKALVKAYSAVAVTKARYGITSREYDSVLKSNHYTSERELIAELKQHGNNQDELRQILDSIGATIQRSMNER